MARDETITQGARHATGELSGEAGAGRRVVMHTFGSLGDLHPYLALGREMRGRGHRVTLATSEIYRAKVEAEGLDFAPVRPDVSRYGEDSGFFARVMNPRSGPEALFRDIIVPAARDTLEDLIAATQGADLFVSHPLTLVGGIVAHKTGAAWVSTMLSPLSLFSAHDPPIFAQSPSLSSVARVHPSVARVGLGYGRRVGASWSGPVRALYAETGTPLPGEPMWEGQHAPGLSLALFSEVLGRPQPDWPPQVRATGFPFYDGPPGEGLDPEIALFLKAGSPPIVCTLGSAAVNAAGAFYQESAYLAQRTGRRVLLLTGRDPANMPDPLPPNVAAFPYAPYSEVFPRACAIVHQGGVGTTAQALRAGKPQLVMPFAHDQYDNAARVKRLGFGHVIARRRYTRARAAGLILRLLMDPAALKRAAEVSKQVREENGTATACDLLEEQLAGTRN